jgi:hypothetical protein
MGFHLAESGETRADFCENYTENCFLAATTSNLQQVGIIAIMANLN